MDHPKKKRIKQYKKEDIERVIDAAAEFAKAILPFGIDFTEKVKSRLATDANVSLKTAPQSLPQTTPSAAAVLPR